MTRPWLWFGAMVLGIAVLAGLLVFGLIGNVIGAPMTVSIHLEGRELLVTGQTNEPNGRQIDVSVTQWDEYFKALDRGSNPGADPTFRFRLSRTVTLKAGSFSTVFSLDGWPTGQAGTEASYALSPTEEPPFGIGVQQDSDGNRYVEASRDFPLP
jgi:hypothetical protein